MAERTEIDRATMSKLETRKLPNPTIGTLRTYARSVGQRLSRTAQADAEGEFYRCGRMTRVGDRLTWCRVISTGPGKESDRKSGSVPDRLCIAGSA